MIPSMQNNEDLLTWKDSSKLPWGLLILFGGGLSIAAQINSTGLGIWIGEGLSIFGNSSSNNAYIFCCCFNYISY